MAIQMLSNVNHLAQYLTLTLHPVLKDVYSHWTQTCSTAGVCSDYVGVQNSPCLIANVGGHVADTCAAGFVCDLWNGADGVAGGDDDSERKTNNYGSVHSGTDNLDICIADPTCSDGVQNNNEGGVDCCLLDSAGNPHGGCNCKHLDYCIDC